jgi:secreted PhoX family phosphatase
MTPTSYPDLNTGTLEAAEILDPLSQGPIAPGQVRSLDWHVIANPNPSGGQTPTHEQAPSATVFNGGEGCWYAEGRVYISTKGNNRVWCIDTANDTIEILYDLSTSSTPDLVNVDNVYVTQCGDVLVAEDPGDLQIVALTPTGAVKPVMQLTGVMGTEICGPALDPSGTRLYFSSQRNPGQTFEITGPFAPLPGVSMLGGTAGTLAASALAGLGAWSLRRRAAERG